MSLKLDIQVRMKVTCSHLRKIIQGLLGGSVGWASNFISAQVMIPGSWDRAPHQAPHQAPHRAPLLSIKPAWDILSLSLSLSLSLK